MVSHCHCHIFMLAYSHSFLSTMKEKWMSLALREILTERCFYEREVNMGQTLNTKCRRTCPLEGLLWRVATRFWLEWWEFVSISWIRTLRTNGGQIRWFWWVLESVTKCQACFLAQWGWQCLFISDVHNRGIRKYLSYFIRSPKMCFSTPGSGLSLVSSLICNYKNPHHVHCHLSWRAPCQKQGDFLLTQPLIRVCPEAWVLITLNLVCITSNSPNGHTIIWSDLICNQGSRGLS